MLVKSRTYYPMCTCHRRRPGTCCRFHLKQVECEFVFISGIFNSGNSCVEFFDQWNDASAGVRAFGDVAAIFLGNSFVGENIE